MIGQRSMPCCGIGGTAGDDVPALCCASRLPVVVSLSCSRLLRGHATHRTDLFDWRPTACSILSFFKYALSYITSSELAYRVRFRVHVHHEDLLAFSESVATRSTVVVVFPLPPFSIATATVLISPSQRYRVPVSVFVSSISFQVGFLGTSLQTPLLRVRPPSSFSIAAPLLRPFQTGFFPISDRKWFLTAPASRLFANARHFISFH
jgi:hypothetical protein